MNNRELKGIYNKLYKHFGPQHWWPADTRLEVAIGAVLTQNTSWSNVERAIVNLKKKKLVSLKKLSNINTKNLAKEIKPAGYFNVKARRLKNLMVFFTKRCGGNLFSIRKIKTVNLRRELLGVNGIGPETADSILLYAFDKPIFVVDAYTKRIFSRLRIIPKDSGYNDMQRLFMKSLTRSAKLFNEKSS
ncbi:endonuclease III domain-containing protein [Thermoproteota archaeon]